MSFLGHRAGKSGCGRGLGSGTAPSLQTRHHSTPSQLPGWILEGERGNGAPQSRGSPTHQPCIHTALGTGAAAAPQGPAAAQG